MNKALTTLSKSAAPFLALLVLSGCASLGGGANNFSCDSDEEVDGLGCMSVRDVYAATNDSAFDTAALDSAHAVAQESRQRAPARPKSPREHFARHGSSADALPAIDALPDSHGIDPLDVPQNYVAPRLPDQPVPVRTPAQVMRVWVAPWENTSGDLVTTGYLYTEIEPRRWVLGTTPEAESQRSLSPLR
ncbi:MULTISPECIES: type IV conjugative transfer system lipoprotein TraV [Halomonas]|uniref:type IV conjugative transfer system lipoprotein TraV n=1 Tax=Halomonas TaxID=2745 RepID=UPI003CE97836